MACAAGSRPDSTRTRVRPSRTAGRSDACSPSSPVTARPRCATARGIWVQRNAADGHGHRPTGHPPRRRCADAYRVMRRQALARGEHLVDEAVFERLIGRQDLVAVDVGVDLLLRAVRVTRERLLEPRAHAHDLGGLDLDVGRLTVAGFAHRGLVDQHARVRQRETLAGRAGRGDHRGGRRRLAEHDGLDLRSDVLHRVVDRRHGSERATG